MIDHKYLLVSWIKDCFYMVATDSRYSSEYQKIYENIYGEWGEMGISVTVHLVSNNVIYICRSLNAEMMDVILCVMVTRFKIWD